MGAICKNCLVELDDDMKRCPLCGIAVNGSGEVEDSGRLSASGSSYMQDAEKNLLQRVIWQVTATLLFSGIAATLIIDYAKHSTITWSIYPVTISLMLLSYASLFAFWPTKTLYRILAGWLLSTLLMVALHRVAPMAHWTVGLAIPLIFAINFVALALLAVFRTTKRKGLNLLAYTIVAIAVLCICIEGIISRYETGVIQLRWSVIVAACLLPVSVALLFIYLRTRNNPQLQKIFHT